MNSCKVVDDRLFEIALAPVGTFWQAEEFEDDRILHDVLRRENFLTTVGQGEDFVFVAAGGESLVEVGGDLAFEFATGPALGSGFDLVEGSRRQVLDGQEKAIVGPRELRWVDCGVTVSVRPRASSPDRAVQA
jgi:hypothetical protein